MTPRKFFRLSPALLFILPIAIALCAPRFAAAGNPTPRPRMTPGHHHTVIESISSDSITITQADGSKTYKITKNTEITFKGEETTADQLQAGMRVQVEPDAADDTAAASITANDPPKDPAAKSGK